MGGAEKRFDRLARNHAHRVDLALRGSSHGVEPEERAARDDDLRAMPARELLFTSFPAASWAS